MQHLVTNRKKCGDYYKRNEILKWDERGNIRNLLVEALAPTQKFLTRPRNSVIVTERPSNAMRCGMWNGRASRRTQGRTTKQASKASAGIGTTVEHPHRTRIDNPQNT